MKLKLAIFSTIFGVILTGMAFAHEGETPPDQGTQDQCPRPDKFFEGFYIGQGLGMVINTSKTDLHFFITRAANAPTDPNINGGLTHSSAIDLFQNHFYGEFYGGWGYQFTNGGHLGVRGGINLSSFDITHKEKSSQTHLNTANPHIKSSQEIDIESKLGFLDYTLDAKLGWVFGFDTMIYLLVGGCYNDPQTVLQIDTVVEQLTDVQPSVHEIMERIEATDDAKGSRLNLRLGFGIERKLTKHLGLNIVYSFTDFRKRNPKAKGSESVMWPGGTEVQTDYDVKLKSSIARHAFTGGLSYHF